QRHNIQRLRRRLPVLCLEIRRQLYNDRHNRLARLYRRRQLHHHPHRLRRPRRNRHRHAHRHHPVSENMAKNSSSHRYHRRGAVYIAVLMTALVVACTGLAALQLARVQNATADGGNSFIEARTIARSAIDIGMLKIRNDPYWRTNLGNGTWVNNQSLGDGTYSLSAVDPIDSDVTKGDNHPIIMTASGTVGGATYKTSVRLEVGPRIGTCLEVSMISGHDTQVNTGTTLTSDQTVSANNQFKANTATINADVEAFKGISGSTYTKSTVNKTSARDMPDPDTALNYYLSYGTTINYSDLPHWTSTELLTNTTFEVDT